MESHVHTLGNLFAQLGLAGEPESVETFIAAHAPLHHTVSLVDAPFWSPAQAAFLKDELARDADWSAVIDRLDTYLRRPA
ncbi:DUF2789 domain-containing protein [Zoogloea sp.]|uniref:DUF2789 domain-containing protein n=1 Tax=Zoogloea sp. TaxID=49181 RepID=UPI00260A9FCD|nr:DUF2789 domain-containing protein [Zoogloea sp.]MDD3354323.1 DUF2789 domain-containing protein [Zoogloea sp.]